MVDTTEMFVVFNRSYTHETHERYQIDLEMSFAIEIDWLLLYYSNNKPDFMIYWFLNEK